MMLALTLVLIVASAGLVWLARPRRSQPNAASVSTEWSGESAARFAAGLIILIYALLALFNVSQLRSAQLLMQQLSAFAAVPLLLSVSVALLINKPLSRMIWGRILLGWCAVFELLRYTNLLEQYQYILCALGVLLGVASLFKFRDRLSYLSIFIWTVMTFVPFVRI